MDKIIIFTVLLLITITGYQYLGKVSVSVIVLILSLIYLLFQKQIDNLLYKKIEGLESNTETITINGTGTLTQEEVNSKIGSISKSINVVIENYTIIDAKAFMQKSNIVQVTIPNTVTKLGREPVNTNVGVGPFYGCTNLNKVIFQENSQLTFIGITTFYQCTALKMIILPTTVTHIGFAAFQQSGLTSITIPDSVTSINSFAFAFCPDLEDVYFEGTSKLSIDDIFSSWMQILRDSPKLKTIYCTSDTLNKWGISAGSNKTLGSIDDLTIVVKDATAATPGASVSPFKDVAVNDTVVCAKNGPIPDAGAAYRYGGNNMIQYYPTPPIAVTWNKDWDKNIITIPDCSKATVGTPKILGTKPAAQCEIKIDGACKSYPNMSNRDWFADNDFGGPKPTTLESCKYREQSWETSCSESANISAKYNQQLIPSFFRKEKESLTEGQSLPTIENGDFSQPPITKNTYKYLTSDTTTVPGWNFSCVLLNQSEAWGFPRPYPNGEQCVSIQNTQELWTNDKMVFTPGITYSISFHACGRDCCDQPDKSNPIDIGLEGKTFYSFTPPIDEWTKYSATFTSDSNVGQRISFKGTWTTSDRSSAIQGISLQIIDASPASFEGSGILPVSQFISPAPSAKEQSKSDDNPIVQPSIVQGLDAKSIAGNPVYYEPGTVMYKGLGYTPSYSEMTYLNNHVYKSEPEKINQVHKKGFCDQTNNIMNNINEKCNALPTDVCASTDCCVLFGGEKCVEGDENGPKNKMAYSDTSIKNRDAYYYQGDCYGNCQKGPRYVQPKQPENQIQPPRPAPMPPVPSAMISPAQMPPVPSAVISPAPRPAELSPVPRSLPNPSASIQAQPVS